jgi:sugar/nucleoside kinase (ribokinase family)
MVGMATLDLVYSIESHPTRESENRVHDSGVAVGGLMGRAALTAARLGYHPKLLAACGTGLMAEVLQHEIAQEEIQATWLIRPGPSQHSVILATRDDGSRTTLWTPQPFLSASSTEKLLEFLVDVDIALLDATDPWLYRETVLICRRLGITTVLDTGSGRPWTADYLGEIDYVLASTKYARKLTPLKGVEAAAELWPGRCRNVFAITEGNRGGAWATGPSVHDAHRWTTPTVDTIDSCGAGDVFHGAFVCGLADGLEIRECFDFSARVAARSTTALGNDAIGTTK